MNLFSITSLLCGTSGIILAIFALLAGNQNSYRVLALCNIAIAIWGFGGFLVANANDAQMALRGWKLAHFGGFFISALFLHLVFLVCETENSKLVVFSYAQALIYNLINYSTDWMMQPMRQAFGFYYIDRTYLSSMAFLTYLALVIFSYIKIIRSLKTFHGEKKNRIIQIGIGFLFGFLGGTSILLPEFRLDILYPFGNGGVFIYIAIMTYAVLRNRILDWEDLAQAVHRDKLAAIGTLATSINHEVRNPLFVIKGLAETCLINIAENSYGSAEAALVKASDAFKRMEQQAARAMDIMRRFALFAKQNTHVKPEFSDINIHELIENILPLVQHELKLDKIELIKNTPPQLTIYADVRHIEEILFNLIVNACQALKVQGGIIEITARPIEDTVVLEIKDNGPGIPESMQKQIFYPFYTSKEEGTGLGLYITKQLVERNGGKISVKSKPGHGTTFILEFKR